MGVSPTQNLSRDVAAWEMGRLPTQLAGFCNWKSRPYSVV
jgi:hypothetical protein